MPPFASSPRSPIRSAVSSSTSTRASSAQTGHRSAVSTPPGDVGGIFTGGYEGLASRSCSAGSRPRLPWRTERSAVSDTNRPRRAACRRRGGGRPGTARGRSSSPAARARRSRPSTRPRARRPHAPGASNRGRPDEQQMAAGCRFLVHRRGSLVPSRGRARPPRTRAGRRGSSCRRRAPARPRSGRSGSSRARRGRPAAFRRSPLPLSDTIVSRPPASASRTTTAIRRRPARPPG